MRRVLAVALVVVALPAAGAARTAGGTPVALVATVDGARLELVDVWTGDVLRKVALPGPGKDVAATFDARRALVASPSAGTVTLVDMRRGRVLARFRGLAAPVDVAVAPSGRRGFVLERDRGTLAVLDLVRRRVSGRVAVGARPSGLAVSDHRVWVAHKTHRHTLTVVEAVPGRAPEVVGQLPAGDAVATLRHVPDSAWLLVTYRGSGDVAKLDAGIAARVVFRKRVGSRVAAVGIDWRTARIWAAAERGRIAILSPRDGARIGTVQAGAPVRAIAAFGSYVAVATARDLRVYAGGRRRALTPVPSGIASVELAVI